MAMRIGFEVGFGSPQIFLKFFHFPYLQYYGNVVIYTQVKQPHTRKEITTMMKQEFETLAGYEVSIDDYNKIIEPMYMATSLTKEEFVKTINKKRFALKSLKNIIKEMKQIAKHLEETCDHYTDTKAYDRLHALIDEYLERRGYIIEGIRYASYMIDDEMTMFKCYHPSKVVIYGRNDYKTIETIDLI